MLSLLNQTQTSKHLIGLHQLEITNRHIKPSERLKINTVQLSDHRTDNFTIELDIDMGYMYISNQSPCSIDYRLNSEPILRHVQKGRKVALMPCDSITLFIPYIDENQQSKSDQLKIYLGEDLSLLLELV